MMDAAHRFEGTVNQVLGDGIMALFGAPIAHEDHALRALGLAQASGEVVLHALPNLYLGYAYQAHGDYRRAIDYYKQAVVSLDGAQPSWESKT